MTHFQKKFVFVYYYIIQIQKIKKNWLRFRRLDAVDSDLEPYSWLVSLVKNQEIGCDWFRFRKFNKAGSASEDIIIHYTVM